MKGRDICPLKRCLRVEEVFGCYYICIVLGVFLSLIFKWLWEIKREKMKINATEGVANRVRSLCLGQRMGQINGRNIECELER